MTDTPKESFKEPEPMYSCSVRGCAEEVSYPADMLRVHGSKAICEGCWDCADAVLNEDEDPIFWHELESFVPAADRRMSDLMAIIEERDKDIAGLENDFDEIQADKIELSEHVIKQAERITELEAQLQEKDSG